MRRYKIQEKLEVEEIICNKCGKVIRVNCEIPQEEVFSAEKRWGYFSNKDNEVHRFDLCESCYDKFVETFQIPVERE